MTTGALNFAVTNDQNLRDSYIQQWNLNIQKKLPATSSGRRLRRIEGHAADRDVRGSQPADSAGRSADTGTAVAQRPPSEPDLSARRSRRQVDRQFDLSCAAGQGRAAHGSGLTFLTAYTWSKSISGPNDIGGQVGGGNFIGGPQDIYYLQGERAVSGFDVTQRFVQTVLYEVPFFTRNDGVTRLLLDGWQASTIITAQSGFPAPVTSMWTRPARASARVPDMVAGQDGNLPGDQRTWTLVQYRGVRRGAVRTLRDFAAHRRDSAAGNYQCDFSVEQDIRISESGGVEFRTEIFNLFNHFNPDPQTVDRNLRSPTFGALAAACRALRRA